VRIFFVAGSIYHQFVSFIQVYKWNFHKGDYIKITKELDKDWSNLLNDKDPNVLNNIFLGEFNAEKDKCIPKVNRKAVSKAKKHNYIIFSSFVKTSSIVLGSLLSLVHV
jgi:hypothetical protein